ncbi:34550_t:CDS:1, partial [Racocetra persica]
DTGKVSTNLFQASSSVGMLSGSFNPVSIQAQGVQKKKTWLEVYNSSSVLKFELKSEL